MDAIRQFRREVEQRLSEISKSIPNLASKVSPIPANDGFWAVINSKEQEGTSHRWSYIIQRVVCKLYGRWDGWTPVSDAPKLTAYNTMEVVLDAAPPQAIAIGTVVYVYKIPKSTTEDEYWFVGPTRNLPSGVKYQVLQIIDDAETKAFDFVRFG